MKLYPRITDDRRLYESVSWSVEQTKSISHDGISGLMENRGVINPMGRIASEIPEAFYGRELAILATGTDEEIAEVSKKYGLLVSPFSKAVRIKQNLDRIQSQTHQSRIISSFDEILEAIAIVEEATETEIAAIKESVLLTSAQQLADDGVTGTVVSFSEIRETAKRLNEVLDVIILLGEGVSVDQLSTLVERNRPKSSPIANLKYIEHCLRDSGFLGITLVLANEDKKLLENYVEELEALALDGDDCPELDNLRYTNLLNEISRTGVKELVSFTEALALGLRGLAIESRRWARCDKCGILFPLTPGKMRKTKKLQGTYCTKECRNAAGQKRYRANHRPTDTSAR